MQFKIFKANSPAHKRETLDIQTFNTVLGTSFTLSLLRLFLAPCQAWIKRKTPQTPSFTSLPEWASNSELSERIRPQKCTDAFETGCWHWRQPSTSCFVPCFPPMIFHKLNVDKLFQLKSSFFNSSTAFSTPFLVFQLHSCFFNSNPVFFQLQSSFFNYNPAFPTQNGSNWGKIAKWFYYLPHFFYITTQLSITDLITLNKDIII